MQSEEIRTEVKDKAPSTNSIWPNGLGFDWRGWEYSYGHKGWAAIRTDAKGNGWLGRGETPADAKANAFIQPD